MEVVVDTSVILSVLLQEPERGRVIEITRGTDLIAPSSLHWEIGNALSAMFKRRRISFRQASAVIQAYRRIPLQLVEVDLVNALEIAADLKIYAYDAYMLECARAHKAPLLTLDGALMECAQKRKLQVLEI